MKNRLVLYIVEICSISIMLLGCSDKVQEIQETEFETLETIDVSGNVIHDYQEYEYVSEEHEEYEYRREPDIDLPDISGFEKDEYGNYILSEEALMGERLPLNGDGQIDYIFYYDGNDNVINPMPSYYENYPEYFTSNGG